MNNDKISQYIGQFGGFLAAVFFFFTTLNIQFEWFNLESIDAFQGVLIAAIPFILLIYGVWKNGYIFTSKAKRQEEALKRQGLK